MGTKNHPGKYDCYANAEPDEPMFVLLGRDPDAPMLVRLWANIRMRVAAGDGSDRVATHDKVVEAMRCANAMEDYYTDLQSKTREKR